MEFISKENPELIAKVDMLHAQLWERILEFWDKEEGGTEGMRKAVVFNALINICSRSTLLLHMDEIKEQKIDAISGFQQVFFENIVDSTAKFLVGLTMDALNLAKGKH